MKALEYLLSLKDSIPRGHTYDKELDEAIVELEVLQGRSCETCKSFKDDNHAPSFDGYCTTVGTYIEGENELLPLDVDRGFHCSRWETKQ